MKLITIKCPNCLGDIQYAQGSGKAVCKYCHGEVLFQPAKSELDLLDPMDFGRIDLKQLCENYNKKARAAFYGTDYANAKYWSHETLKLDAQNQYTCLILYKVRIVLQRNHEEELERCSPSPIPSFGNGCS